MKFQDFKFHNVDEMIETLPVEQKEITQLIRSIFLDSGFGLNEKLSYNVPFYSHRKSIGFIWPGAIPWGKKQKEGVELGFSKAYLFPPNNYIQLSNRKQVGIRTIYKIEDIDQIMIRQLLEYAFEIDGLL